MLLSKIQSFTRVLLPRTNVDPPRYAVLFREVTLKNLQSLPNTSIAPPIPEFSGSLSLKRALLLLNVESEIVMLFPSMNTDPPR